jgi:hypothetical protein
MQPHAPPAIGPMTFEQTGSRHREAKQHYSLSNRFAKQGRAKFFPKLFHYVLIDLRHQKEKQSENA